MDNTEAVADAQANAAEAQDNLAEAQAQLDDARTAEPESPDTTADYEALKQRLEKLDVENRKLKDENGARRVTAKEAQEQNEKLRKVAQLLGLEPDDSD
ncbi:hypothetical protein, partial [Corynebacterium sp.]|uniref:hypothetical protein n=1 Tax=Corynebacterium sp. TaxID=1720 RepID=UPI002A915E2A